MVRGDDDPACRREDGDEVADREDRFGRTQL
jgi:hypothetical protein